MSFCTLESDDFRSDLDCFEDLYGLFVTVVASYRTAIDFPPLPDFLYYPAECAAELRARRAAVLAGMKYPIGLPHDGKIFGDPGLSEFIDRLLALRELGYRVPDYALEQAHREWVAEQPGHTRWR